MPLAIEVLIPITSGILSTGTFNSLAQAAAAAMVPTIPVVCHPPRLDAVAFARPIRAATSQPMMNAATASDGDAPVVSAIGRIAGITGDTDCPLRKVKS